MRRVLLFIVALVFWMLVTWSLDWQSLLVGAAAAVLTSLIFGKRFAEEPRKWFQPVRYFWLLVYIPYFLWECIKANFDVAYRVLHPRMPIRPGIVKVRTNLKTEMARTALANSITMTPGTLTVEMEGEYLYIHWIYVRDQDLEGATKELIEHFEKLLTRIFD